MFGGSCARGRGRSEVSQYTDRFGTSQDGAVLSAGRAKTLARSEAQVGAWFLWATLRSLKKRSRGGCEWARARWADAFSNRLALEGRVETSAYSHRAFDPTSVVVA